MEGKFVAVNYISCDNSYKDRFEELFGSRAKMVDIMPGFVDMYVLKPQTDTEAYLVISHWDSEERFQNWTKSKEFMEGHKRAFEDLAQFKKEGKIPPLKSDFKTYQILCK